LCFLLQFISGQSFVWPFFRGLLLLANWFGWLRLGIFLASFLFGQNIWKIGWFFSIT